jgi:hypothetical protein
MGLRIHQCMHSVTGRIGNAGFSSLAFARELGEHGLQKSPDVNTVAVKV